MASSEGDRDPSSPEATIRHLVEAVAAGGAGSAEELKRLLDTPAKTASVSAVSADIELDLVAVSMLKDKLHRQVVEGRTKPAREQVLSAILNEIEILVKASSDDETSISQDQLWLGRWRELMWRASFLLSDASYGAVPPVGSRRSILLAFLEAQQHWLAREASLPNLCSGETQANADLFLRLGAIGANLAAAGDDVATTAIEKEALRQVCVDIRRFAQRRNLTI